MSKGYIFVVLILMFLYLAYHIKNKMNSQANYYAFSRVFMAIIFLVHISIFFINISIDGYEKGYQNVISYFIAFIIISIIKIILDYYFISKYASYHPDDKFFNQKNTIKSSVLYSIGFALLILSYLWL